MATLTARAESWPIAGRFIISRGAKTEARVVAVEIADGAAKGRGECLPYPRYDETIEGTLAAIERLRPRIEAGMGREELQAALKPCAARNALDCALWDLEAKRTGTPVWKLAGLPEPRTIVTCYTISLDEPEAMRAQAARSLDRPILKVKLNGERVIERLRAVRAGHPGARLVADANEAWSVDLLRALATDLAGLGVEMIEQPLPAGRDEGLAGLDYPIPLCADESFHDRATIGALKGRYRVVNIKLDKTGGLTEAIAVARDARAAGFELMVGCMVATSLAMAPAALLAPLARVVDLDGPLILAKDRVPGIRYEGAVMGPAPRELWG